MNPWLVAAAAAATGLLVSKVQRGSTAVMLFAAASVVLGAVLITFSYNDAKRAALGEARLENAHLADIARRQVRCSNVTWHCELASAGEHALHVPFECAGSPKISAAFYDGRQDCAGLANEVAGYLIDTNEAGGGAADWVLQVDAKPRTFPDLVTWFGLGVVVLGFAFPGLLARSKRLRLTES